MKKFIMSLMLVSGLVFASANPVDLKQVPESAKFLIHFDMEKFKETELGKEVINKALENKDVNGLNQILTVFGVDPINQVNDVTVYGSGFDKGNWLVIVDGTVSILKVLEQIKENGKYEKEISNGIEIYSVTIQEKNFYFFSESNCIYFAKQKSMIDLHTSLVCGIVKSAESVGSEVFKSVVSEGIISVGVASGFPVHEKNNPMAEALKQVESIAASVKEESSYVHVVVSMKSKDEEAAKSLHSVVMGFVSLGKMQGEKVALIKESLDSFEAILNGNIITFKSKISVNNAVQIIESKRIHAEQK